MYNNHCCGANRIFDHKGAMQEMKRYRKKGPGRVTRKILTHLDDQEITNKTLLDIGGGIGAISWFFLEKGGGRILDVDASGGYLFQAEKYALDKGWLDKCQFIQGDFSTLNQSIGEFDFVTLDKVVCCYPDYKGLLARSTDKCREKLVLSFPVRNILSRLIVGLGRFYFYLRKNPFRTYVHAPLEIERYIQSRGFTPLYRSIVFPWHVQVYSRLKE